MTLRVPRPLVSTYHWLARLWFRFQESWAFYFNISRRVSLIILGLTLVNVWLIINLVTTERYVEAGVLVSMFTVAPLVAIRPELVILLVTASRATLFAPSFWALHSIGTRTFTIPALLLLLGVAVMMIRFVLRRPDDMRIWRAPNTVAVMFFLFMVVILGFYQTVVVMGKGPGEFSEMILWMTYFLLIGTITTRSNLKVFMSGLFTIGLVTATLTMLQSIAGPHQQIFIRAGFGKDLRIEEMQGMTRVLSPGMNLLLMLFILAWQNATTTDAPSKRIGWVILALFYAGSTLFTLTRTLWILAILAVLLLMYFHAAKYRMRMLVAGATVMLMLAMVIPILSPAYLSKAPGAETFVERISKRFLSTFEEQAADKSTSLGDRYAEIPRMLERWSEYPILGIGWGNPYYMKAEYNPLSNSIRYKSIDYIHNSFYWFLGKNGILGAIGFVTLLAAGIIRGYILFRFERTLWARNLIMALWVFFICLSIALWAHPHFAFAEGIIPGCIALALMEVAHVLANPRKKTEAQIARDEAYAVMPIR